MEILDRVYTYTEVFHSTIPSWSPRFWTVTVRMATAETTGTGRNEYGAIERHYDALVDTLGKTVDPADTARKLGEESLISDGEFCNNK